VCVCVAQDGKAERRAKHAKAPLQVASGKKQATAEISFPVRSPGTPARNANFASFCDCAPSAIAGKNADVEESTLVASRELPSQGKLRSRLFAVAVLAAVVFGAAIGLGAFTFVYANGSAYLTNDPKACANCHVMRAQLEAWQKSSHHAVATCNDCHAPPSGLAKYWVKALNGYHHSLAFTTGDFHEPIRITERNRRVTEEQCRRCHQATVAAMGPHGGGDEISCVRCHDSVGHRTTD
jgi:cytochrome c nitrite reductase small subunit